MPLIKRLIYDCSSYSHPDINEDSGNPTDNDEIDTTNVSDKTISNILGLMHQLSILYSCALEAFQAITLLVEDTHERISLISHRTNSLISSAQLVERKVASSDIEPMVSFKSKYLKNREMITPSLVVKPTNYCSIKVQYKLCRSLPQYWRIEPYWNEDCYPYFSDPSLFFQEWLREELAKQELMESERINNKAIKKEMKKQRRIQKKEARLRESTMERIESSYDEFTKNYNKLKNEQNDHDYYAETDVAADFDTELNSIQDETNYEPSVSDAGEFKSISRNDNKKKGVLGVLGFKRSKKDESNTSQVINKDSQVINKDSSNRPMSVKKGGTTPLSKLFLFNKQDDEIPRESESISPNNVKFDSSGNNRISTRMQSPPKHISSNDNNDDNYMNRLSSSIIRQNTNTAKTENSNNSVISNEEKVDEYDDEYQSNMKTAKLYKKQPKTMRMGNQIVSQRKAAKGPPAMVIGTVLTTRIAAKAEARRASVNLLFSSHTKEDLTSLSHHSALSNTSSRILDNALLIDGTSVFSKNSMSSHNLNNMSNKILENVSVASDGISEERNSFVLLPAKRGKRPSIFSEAFRKPSIASYQETTTSNSYNRNKIQSLDQQSQSSRISQRIPTTQSTKSEKNIISIEEPPPPPPNSNRNPPPPPPPMMKPKPPDLLSNIRDGLNLRKTPQTQQPRTIDVRTNMLNAIKSGGVTLKNVEDNSAGQKAVAVPQNTAIAAILANRSKIAGSDSESDGSDSDFTDDDYY
eukprot:gene8309-11241_t